MNCLVVKSMAALQAALRHDVGNDGEITMMMMLACLVRGILPLAAIMARVVGDDIMMAMVYWYH